VTSKKKKPAVDGFTAVEVLIVLAIAGLIILACLLTVPTAMRTQRNNSRKADAAMVGSQRLQYDQEINTSFSAPPGGFTCAPPITSKMYCQYIDKRLTYYNLSDVYYHFSGYTKPASGPTISNPKNILTDTHLKCDSAGKNAIPSDSAADMVVLYMIESTSGDIQQCIQGMIFANS
jgi:prepilin-type N-terminal cleavage/methylation domain-containing protein